MDNNSEQDKFKAFLNSLAASVITAIKGGNAGERAKLVAALSQMKGDMPGDAGEEKEFLGALIGLLEGKPAGAEGLSGIYAALYGKIVERIFDTGRKADTGDPEKEMREFLTQLSASVIVVKRTGTPDDKKALVAKLREIQQSLPQDKYDEALFILALASIIEDNPVVPDALPEPYSHVYRKLLASI
jgi:hypothetical protein